ncbi:hypothetical protein [Arthrobacter sp. PsM3]|uniref:hypothetical protein n=1 Tax=Arthrobacter sp. PsM3 TaxID=3030531 RepID=UPI00263BA255|nr:hypothetical protein [Arthrobacter sp. PsM3]MDN4643256.1 hypothetical protein [Arthrobacter sp. PsM3]
MAAALGEALALGVAPGLLVAEAEASGELLAAGDGPLPPHPASPTAKIPVIPSVAVIF